MDTDEQTRLFRVWKTIHGMLNDRGYVIAQANLELTIEGFREKYDQGSLREMLTLLASKRDDPQCRIYVFFIEEAKITIPILNKYAKRMQTDRVNKAIMISQGGISHSAKEGIKELQPHFMIEHFEENELMVNITKHELVPTHILLTSDEKAALLLRYRVKESQLPKIQINDPVSRYYGLVRGDVVKIDRPSETAGRYITYRLVV